MTVSTLAVFSNSVWFASSTYLWTTAVVTPGKDLVYPPADPTPNTRRTSPVIRCGSADAGGHESGR
jgi:hypothetical protein